MKWKRKIITVVFLMFICLEIQPPSIRYSSVFTSSEQTEHHLYVQMNTFLKVDKERITKKIIGEHQKINQTEGERIYTLHLYRTGLHYKWNCEYDTLICNENGAIICCETDLGV